MKTCSICLLQLPLDDFDNQQTGKLGRRADCKECRKRFMRSEKGLVKALFGNMKSKSIRRKHTPPAFTEEQLFTWITLQPNFGMLYNAWINSGYITDSKPSVDRIDDYKPYTLMNIRLTTTKENIDRYYQDAINGINTKSAQAVEQYTLDGAFIKRYHSYKDASRALKVNTVSAIRNVAEGTPIIRVEPDGSIRTYVPKKAYGYVWKKP